MLKSFFSDKVGGTIFGHNFDGKYRKQVHELEKKLVESIKQRAGSGQNSFRSVNSIIMRFPQFKEGLRHIKEIFEKYGEFFFFPFIYSVFFFFWVQRHRSCYTRCKSC